MKSIIASLYTFLIITGSLQAQFTSNHALSNRTIQRLSPDLVVTKIRLPYIAPTARVYMHRSIPLQVNVTIKNNGAAIRDSISGFRADLRFANASQVSKPISRLQPGQSLTLKMRINVPASYNGRYISLSSFVDVRGQVRESNERNNYRKLRVKLPRYRKLNQRTR